MEGASSTSCDKGSPLRDTAATLDAFARQLRRDRTVFLSLRAQTASTELALNRRRLANALVEVRHLRVSEVIPSQSSPADDCRTGTADAEGSNRKRGAKRSHISPAPQRLELGTIVSFKLNTKEATPPRFRKPYCLPKRNAIPTFTSWSFISANQQQHKVRNQKRLFYTDDDTGETIPASDDEKESQTCGYARWDGKDVEWREYCLKQTQGQFSHLPSFAQMLATHLEIDVASVEERLRKEDLQEQVPDTVTLLCRRCLQYNCSLHPKSNVIPIVQGTPRRQNSGSACGSQCWLLQGRTSSRDPLRSQTSATTRAQSAGRDLMAEDAVMEDQWAAEDIQLLEKGLDIYGDNSCVLQKFVVTKNCSEIHRYLMSNPGIGKRKWAQFPRRRKPTKKVLIGNRKGAPVVAKRLQHSETELWHQYLPCACKSSCSATCPCVKSNNFCDKYCACWNGPKSTRKTCSNAWKGCKCVQRCETNRCPCVAASRECDPDLCSRCHSDGVIQCCNMSIRTHSQKRVAMGLSEINGWGTFMLENVKKDELIGEYTGELISDEEAERRGRIYDMEDKSYLFSATAETVIDANHRGNKLRFANHSSEPNCHVKYLLVDGDYRVGIFASREITAGEELLYDYGSSFLSNWNMPWMDQSTTTTNLSGQE